MTQYFAEKKASHLPHYDGLYQSLGIVRLECMTLDCTLRSIIGNRSKMIYFGQGVTRGLLRGLKEL